MILAAWALATAGAVLLCSAGVHHIWRRDRLTTLLRTHRLPAASRHLIGAGLGIVELAVGTTFLAGLLSGPQTSTILIAFAYTAFCGYLLRLLRVAPDAPCGCLPDDEPAGVVGIVRAAVIALAAWYAALVPWGPQPLSSRLGLVGAGVMTVVIIQTLVGLFSLRSRRG